VLEDGDAAVSEVWRRILAAIEEFRHESESNLRPI
jgi:hypothetical protein